jgi:hypothetical protein
VEARPDDESRIQAALVAVRDACGRIGHAWLQQLGTTVVAGTPRVRVRLEPVWQRLTLPDVILALGRHGIRPVTVRPRPGVDLRTRHSETRVEVDILVAEKLSSAARRALDETLGRGWNKRGGKVAEPPAKHAAVPRRKYRR